MLWVYRRAKNLNASIIAANERSMIDTASNVGPLLASDVDSGRLPHFVPVVPAPKVEATAGAAEKVMD